MRVRKYGALVCCQVAPASVERSRPRGVAATTTSPELWTETNSDWPSTGPPFHSRPSLLLEKSPFDVAAHHLLPLVSTADTLFSICDFTIVGGSAFGVTSFPFTRTAFGVARGISRMTLLMG